VKDRQWELDELMRIIEGEIEARERTSGTGMKLNNMPGEPHLLLLLK